MILTHIKEKTLKTHNMNTEQKLSANFTLREMVRSRAAREHFIDNTPTEVEVENLKTLVVNLLQPIRDMFGVIHITSGFRCRKLNSRLRGSSTSHHVKGMAADFVCEDMARTFIYIVKNFEFTQMIWEFGTDESPDWIHISYDKNNLKCQVLRAFEEVDGSVSYVNT